MTGGLGYVLTAIGYCQDILPEYILIRTFFYGIILSLSLLLYRYG